MKFSWVEMLGILAGAQTTISFLPQVIKVWKTKSAEDISLTMYLVFCSGVACWLAYGLLIGSFSIIAANVVTFVLALAILLMKLRYTARKKAPGKTHRSAG